MKYFKEIALVAATTTTTTLLSGISSQASASSMVELTYQTSQIQCGANGDKLGLLVDVYYGGELVKGGLAVKDSVMVPDFEGVELDYKLVDNSSFCEISTPSSLLLGQDDEIPNLPGAFEQESIASLVSELKDFEKLYLVELGTTDSTDPAYDLQDVIMIVNNEPDLAPPAGSNISSNSTFIFAD